MWIIIIVVMLSLAAAAALVVNRYADSSDANDSHTPSITE